MAAKANEPLDFEAMFKAYIADSQKVWAHDRSSTLGASEVFGCIRKGWFSKRGAEFGFEKDEDYEETWGATRRGDIIENHFVVPALDYLPKGVKALFAGADQQTLVQGKNSATPDGLLTNLKRNALAKYGVEDIGSSCVTLEIKSIDPRVGLREEKAIHHGQTQVQMGLIRELTPHKPNYAVILYVDASFLDNIKVFVVKFEERLWNTAKKRAANVWAIDDPSKLTPEGKFDGSCEYCPFKRSCALVTTGAIPTSDVKKGKHVDLEDALMTKLIQEYDAAKAAHAKTEYAFELAKQAIKERMQALRENRVSGSWGKASWVRIPGRKTIDAKKMAEDHGIDIAAYETEGTPYDKLTINLD